jgi:hypothetical protein
MILGAQAGSLRSPTKYGTREFPITSFNLLTYYPYGLGRGCGVGRGLGVALGVVVGEGVAVGVGLSGGSLGVGDTDGVTVGVAVGVGDGPPPTAANISTRPQP